jgi:hypothetical protein
LLPSWVQDGFGLSVGDVESVIKEDCGPGADFLRLSPPFH